MNCLAKAVYKELLIANFLLTVMSMSIFNLNKKLVKVSHWAKLVTVSQVTNYRTATSRMKRLSVTSS